MKRFEGKTVWISGALGGFGLAAAKAFAREGASLVLTDLNDVADGTLDGIPADCFAYLAGDISDPAHAEALAELALSRFGSLDVAVNNAGIIHSNVKLHQIGVDEARRVIDVDLMGVWYAMRAQLPVMEGQFRKTGSGGVIVNIASAAGTGGAPRLGIYAAAKHGVVGLTRTAALEYASKGIRVNAVCPSFARTAMATDIIGKAPEPMRELAEQEMVRGIPMRRLAEPSEVVAAVLFAADPANGFMSGETLAVDGGLAAL